MKPSPTKYIICRICGIVYIAGSKGETCPFCGAVNNLTSEDNND
jgi:rubrerythrin